MFVAKAYVYAHLPSHRHHYLHVASYSGAQPGILAQSRRCCLLSFSSSQSVRLCFDCCFSMYIWQMYIHLMCLHAWHRCCQVKARPLAGLVVSHSRGVAGSQGCACNTISVCFLSGSSLSMMALTNANTAAVMLCTPFVSVLLWSALVSVLLCSPCSCVCDAVLAVRLCSHHSCP